MNLTRLVLVAASLVQLASAGMMDRRLVYDSLRDVEPWQRRQWLAERGLQDYYKAQSWRPTTDSGLRCVGRWSYGPSVKVSLRATADDTIVCLARGSGASIIRFRSQDSLTLDLLSDINCNGVVSRAIIDDTLVYCGMNQGGTGIEVWGVSDLTSPQRLSYVYLPPIMDIAVKDTFLYVTGYVQDSLRIFNVADPHNPVQVGACSDSGYPMCVSGDYCYLADRGGINIIDVSNPAAPYRAGKTGGGGIALSVAVRDSFCFFGVDNSTLQIYNVRNPASPAYLGSLSGTQPSDLYLPETNDTVLYTSTFEVVSIADPSSPRRVGLVYPPGWEYGVAALPALNYALVADFFDGMVAINITTPTAPSIDTFLFNAGLSEDVCIDQGRAYVAQHQAGLRILDITNPAAPYLLGQADTLGTRPSTHTAVARDSFAYVGWTGVPYFRSFDVSDPARPRLAGGLDIVNPAEDMVLGDTLVYVAEDGRLQIVNIAQPREPLLEGSCMLGDVWDLDVEDSMAYVTSNVLTMVNITRPDSPRVVATWNAMVAVDVEDTIAYTIGSGAVWSVSVARPAQPYVLDSVGIPDWKSDIVIGESLVFAGGQALYVIDKRDPGNLRIVGRWTPPKEYRRLRWSPPHIYAACYEAGICILETLPTGVAETRSTDIGRRAVIAYPSVTSGVLAVDFGRSADRIYVRNTAGQRIAGPFTKGGDASVRRLEIDLSGYPDGVYFIESATTSTALSAKVVKTGRR